jgi:uncharacterized surface protein with fasciclin (FAS1) repeats
MNSSRSAIVRTVGPIKPFVGEIEVKKLLVLAALFVAAPFVAAADEKTIVETAVGNKDFSTLVAAVKAAELVETLNGEGPFTVFAPTNEAFEKLGKEAIDSVLKDKKKLTSILTAHVVKGKVMAADVAKLDGKEAETIEGTKFKISVKDGTVKIGGATVKVTDIKCKNGVIHVIDTVLMPAAK